MHDGPDKCKQSNEDYFWNRKYGPSKTDEFYANTQHRMDTLTSRAIERETFNLDTPTSQQSTQMMALDVSGF